jgi:hypothetical protein
MARAKPGPLLIAFDAAVAANGNIDSTVDQATVEAGRSIADAIDKITADEDATATEKTKALYLTPHLISILRELLATPLARKNVGLAVSEHKVASRLSLIQAQAAKHSN